MWKLIDKSSMIAEISNGQIIALTPDGQDHYTVKSMHVDGYVSAIHCNGKTEVKFFPEHELIEHKWWIKQ